MIARYPTDLPRLCALLAGLSVLAGGFSWMGTEIAIGRPSSTTGFGFITIPILAVAVAAAGSVAGLILRELLCRLGVAKDPARVYPGRVLVSLFLLPVLFGIYGIVIVWRVEANARPRVLISTAFVTRATVGSAPRPLKSRPAEQVWESGRTVTVPAGLPTVVLQDLRASFQFEDLRSPTVDLSWLDGVRSMSSVRLDRRGVTEGYVAVADGRATGRRSALIVLSADLRLLHVEIVERPRGTQMMQLCAEPFSDDPSSEVAILSPYRARGYEGCGTSTSSAVRYRLSEQPNRPLQPAKGDTPR